ncbi:hairy and enhancer of split-related protein helt-like [Saccostrea echinata]|uniref:hairy and enhancer of split-related protein helt-like n=1 Tax=Saccostrea echinata TaxID=191078 RepID=UPI002A7ECB6C|nr:hairy and enhancer of split-related protein helt-like [Saccostrea echinata]
MEKICKKIQVAEQTSHKVIEKRRRDRINSCLSELSQAVPAAFSKQTSGKLEKAEILEMTVDYLRAIQATEIGLRFENSEWFSSDIWADFMHHYQVGYNDCIREIQRFMTDVEGLNATDDRCVRLVSYLQTRFRPESSVAGGAAYRDLLQRLMTSTQSRRNMYLSNSTSPAGFTSFFSPGTRRFSPYIYPKTVCPVSPQESQTTGAFPLHATYSTNKAICVRTDNFNLKQNSLNM